LRKCALGHAQDHATKEAILAKEIGWRKKIEMSHLGRDDAGADQEDDRTSGKRTLTRVTIADKGETGGLVGKQADLRFQYGQENACFIDDDGLAIRWARVAKTKGRLPVEIPVSRSDHGR
jgi:hypothetical protein